MASSPSRASKQQHAGKAIGRGYNRFKYGLLSPSPLSSQSARSTTAPALPTGAGSPFSAPDPSTTFSSPTVIQPVLHQKVAVGGPSTLDASPEFTAGTVTTTDKLIEVGKIAFSGLETALQVLEKGANAFPPLKSAVRGFIACLDIIQAAAMNVRDYGELTLELTTMAGTLNQYLSELGSEDPNGSASRIALSIEAEVAHIGKQQRRGRGRRIMESAQDMEDVIRRYRRIEGLFRQLQNDIGLRTWRNIHEQHITTLLRGMSPVDDARYNSSYSTTIKRRGCTVKTREKIQADLQDWARDPNAAPVYWMNGMAGTGKTTIAYSLCEWLEANQRLGASFFCSRLSSSCRNVNWIVPTIAYQLARYSPAFQSALCNVLKDDPDASKLNVVRQFERLMREPMLASKYTMPEGVVVVIDALDECEDDYGIRLVLGTLLQLGTNLPLKFFVTSRPESAIRDKMLFPGGYSPSVIHLHDIEQSIVKEDVKKYLTEALSFMSPAPSEEQIEQLAKRAGKLFIYAATAVRFILPGKGPANPVTRFNLMLTTDAPANKAQSSKMYKELDELYSTILAAAFDGEGLDDEVETMRLVLRTAACAKEPMTALTMASLLGLTEEQVSSALQPLRSVLHVSETSGLVSTFHASFPDYMLDQLRSENFYCDQTHHSELLAHHCFEVMKKQLRFNICGLESSFAFDKDVPELEHRVTACISPALFYACQYWGEHLQLAAASEVLHDNLVDFLTHRLLFWMEVLNLKRCVVKGIAILVHAENWLSSVTSTATQKLVAEARDFVTRFAAGACSRSTPHIYLSALPLCARSSSVYTDYWRRTQGLIDVKGTAISQRDSAAQATWMTNSTVCSVAFSPGGTRIVSGSFGRAIQVWDSRTGNAIVGPFKGHIGPVQSVSFSPDGTRIISGSHDRTIRVWDAHTGDPITKPFKGHEGYVFSVAFSPDGTRIVSGSSDQTIRVWDACTEDIIAGPFKGHTGSVQSVAFSPDGTRIASGSYDQTIRLWDAYTGNAITEPLTGHEGYVFSVAFSPDGTRIASGSSDQTIRVWDACTGNAIAEPFKGCEGYVFSVAFSPDSTSIVSGSSDSTVQVWDARTGNAIAGPFKGHTDPVMSVAFSPDGAHVVSGSHDRTIQVWDTRISNTAIEPSMKKGHTSSVQSVAFSPDGARVVSGSHDQTVQVWDARTGDTIIKLSKGHTSSVLSVAFSPDGTQIVSGSHDRTIRVWNVCTGDTIAEPFKGHTDSVMSVAFSPDGTRIVSGSYDQTIRVWKTRTSNAIAKPFKGHTDLVMSVAFSSDGSRIVSGSYDRTIRVWDAYTGDTIAEPFKGHTDSVMSVAFSPDGTRIISGSCDRTIRMWDALGCTGNLITEPFKGHTDTVTSVAFSPDGTRVVSGSYDQTIRVWDAHTGNATTKPFKGHTDLVMSVAFSPNGARIVSGSYDQTIRVWDACTGYAIAEPLHGHTGSVKSAPFSADQETSLPDIPATRIVNPIRKRYLHGAFAGIEDFDYNSDGWVTANNVPLFWVSPDFFTCLPNPRNTLVIGPKGTALIDYQCLLLGERWSECYSP